MRLTFENRRRGVGGTRTCFGVAQAASLNEICIEVLTPGIKVNGQYTLGKELKGFGWIDAMDCLDGYLKVL